MTSATGDVRVEPRLDTEGLHRHVGFFGLLWASEGSIIGSGWLFGALYATNAAGPASLISWGVAAFIVILLALVHAELGGLFPVSGGTSRFPHYAFGSFAGATFGWFSYLQAATVAPIEVLATIQYTSDFSWARGWYTPAGTNASGGITGNTLTGAGIWVAAGLMVFFVLMNIIGIRWLTRANSGITTWKVMVPILTILVFCAFHFHSGNFSAAGGFFLHIPGQSLFKGLETALPSAGIVFALLGFEQAVQLGGESANPKRDLPRAVIGSILLGALIYILVQVAFIAALNPSTILSAGTWSNLGMGTALGRSPFATVAAVAGIGWLAWILRADAVISPGGTGLIYLTSTSRISYALSKNGYVPTIFEATTKKTKVPVFSVVIGACIGMIFLLPFPSWSSLVGVVTSASVMMYAAAPLALGAMRRAKPDLPRPYRLPIWGVLCPLSFILANFIVYWSGWGVVSTLMAAVVIGYVLMGVCRVFKFNPKVPTLDFRSAVWVLPYLGGMTLLSYFGSFGHTGLFNGLGWFKDKWIGGNGTMPFYYDLLIIAGFSLMIYGWAIFSVMKSEKIDAYIEEVYPAPSATH